ncbi:MAG: M56 family metallopeptidase [Planctomycetota bacterium]|jgi:beta-lactamase regulating signal transducer with metallopeptidase domain/HEAT repeat protein/tetratricopeptide (TPR) repeat protein
MTGFWALVVWNVALATVLAVAVALASCLKAVRRRPGLRHVLWMLVLLKLITPPVIPLPVLPSQPAESSMVWTNDLRELPESRPDLGDLHESRPFQPPTDGRQEQSDLLSEHAEALAPREQLASSAGSTTAAPRRADRVPWPVVLVWLSVCGTLLLLGWNALQMLRVSGLLRRANPGDERLEGIARQAASGVGARVAPEIRVVDARMTPLLWARWRRPVVVLPKTLVDRLGGEQVSCIVRHELAHHVRRDHWANAFSLAVAALFWWHPVVWWARREMHVSQELCCDALAIGGSAAARRCYAETLLHTLEFIQAERSLLTVLAVRFGPGYSIQRRFEMIADATFNERQSWWTYAVILAVAALLPCLPVRGKPPTNADEERAAEAQRGDDSETSWGEPLLGLRMRLTTPAGTEYRRGVPLPLQVEMQNVTDGPIRFADLHAKCRIKVHTEAGDWLGVARFDVAISPWERAAGSLAPKEVIRWQVRFDRLRLNKPAVAGSAVEVRVSVPKQIEEPGKLPRTSYSKPVVLKLIDALPALLDSTDVLRPLLRSDDVSDRWTEEMDLVYREVPGLGPEAARAIHIDGQGRVTMLDCGSPGRTETTLGQDRLDELAARLWRMRIWEHSKLQREIAWSDEPEMRVSLAYGGSSMVGDYPSHVVRDNPALTAFEAEIKAVIEDAVKAAGKTTTSAAEELAAERVLPADDPSTAEEDRSAGRPVATRKLWGKEYSEAVSARNRVDRMRADLEKRMSAARREWRKAGNRSPLPTSDRFEAQAAEVVRAYQEVINRYPHTEIAAGCALRLAGSYQYQGKFDEAAQVSAKAATEFAGTPEGVKAVFSTGLIHLQARHDPAEASKWFARVTRPAKPAGAPYDEADKFYLSAQEQLIKCELMLGLDSQAEERMKKLKQVFPQYAGEVDRFYQAQLASRASSVRRSPESTKDAVPTPRKRATDADVQAFRMEIKGSSGNPVAAGVLSLPSDMGDRTEFTGSCSIRVPDVPEMPTTQLDYAIRCLSQNDGTLSGRVTDGVIRIALHPQADDDTIYLEGQLAEGSFNGRWYYQSYAGYKEFGVFHAKTEDRPPETTGAGPAITVDQYDEALRAHRAQAQRQAPSLALEASVDRLRRVKAGAETDEAVAALARQGDAAVAEIGRQLAERNPSFGQQHRAVRVLEAVNSEESRAILRRMARDELRAANSNIESSAARALIACDAREAWGLLASDTSQVLTSALNAVEGQPVDEKHMPLLRKCLGHETALVRWRAAEVMASDPTGKRADETVEAVGQALTAVASLPNVNDPARYTVPTGWTLGEACYQRYLNILVRVKVDNEALHALAKRIEGRGRDTVLLALARRGDKSVHDELVRLAQDQQADMFRAWAATALGEIGTLEDLPLLRTLAETDPFVREGPWGSDERGLPLPPGMTALGHPVRVFAQRAIHALERKAKEPEK